MKIETVDPLAIANWDELVHSYRGYSFFHSSSWIRVLQSTYRYRPLAFLSPSCLISAMEVNSAITGNRGVCLPFSDYCAPLSADNEGDFQEIIGYILDYGRSRRWSHFDIRGGPLEAILSPACHYIHHTLELQREEAGLYNSFSDNVKRNIRKAFREQLAIRFTTSLEALKVFYRFHTLNRRKHGLPPQPFSFFSNMHRYILEAGKGHIVEAIINERPIASAIYMHFGDQAIYKYGASDPAHLQFRPNNLIMWEAIKFYNQHGYRELSLGRTSPEDDGLVRYKDGWGTRKEHIPYFRFVLGKNGIKGGGLTTSANSFFRRVPLFMLPAMGKILYRHFG